MKKLLKKMIAVGLISVMMFSAVMLPCYAAQDPFILDQHIIDSCNAQFYNGILINRTGQQFEEGFSQSSLMTFDTVPTNDSLNYIAYFCVTYEDGLIVRRYNQEYKGYLDGHTFYSVKTPDYPFDLTGITDTVRAWTSLTTRSYNSSSNAKVPGYYSQITKLTYDWEIYTTRDHIIENGLDWLNE